MAKTQSDFSTFANLGETLATTTSRLERARLIADYLRALDPADAETAARLLVGRPFPESEGRRLSMSGSAVWAAMQLLGVAATETGWAGAVDFGEVVRRAIAPCAATVPSLLLSDITTQFAAIASAAGSGSRRTRVSLLRDLLARATELEAKYIAKIVIGEMRHGVQDGIVLDAIATMIDASAIEVRRAHQALGDIGRLAALAKATGKEGLSAVAVQLFRPLKPMLAQTAATVAEAFATHGGRLALEWKLDGARLQIHKDGTRVRMFSRRLKDLTASLPEIETLVQREVRADTAILEGEVMAVAGERFLPFQELMRRFRRIRDVAETASLVSIRLFLFDLLYADGTLLLTRTSSERWDALQGVRGNIDVVPRSVPASVAEGQELYDTAVASGAEGVMAKALDQPYTPGVRGSGWLKIKKIVTLDLVIIAADWGYGRRHGWLSNYHLAARDDATNTFVALGKTFKGLTDEQFRAMTERLLQRKTEQQGGTVFVRPEVVVEVRFSDIQRSTTYPCGMALRFARIARIRDDKTPAEADTLDTVRQLFASQG
jgi:DNA ligase 1